MVCTRLFAVGILAAMPVLAWSYDSAFTLAFENPSDSEGWEDTTNGQSSVVTGEKVSVDTPAFPVPPESAPNFNGTNWLRLGVPTQAFGVGTYTYDGRAGGTATDATDFVITADVYINTTVDHRYQVALFGRWTAGAGNAPLEVFYSHNTPSQPNGFGWRHGGITTQYNGFTTTTVTSQWVRMKLDVKDNQAFASIDQERDGVYDFVSPPLITTALSPGRIGFQMVINDPANGSAGLPGKFGYFDNLTYVPYSRISDWSVY